MKRIIKTGMIKESNKKMGNDFEIELCKLFQKHGWWVTRLNPDSGGNQPVDIIASKDDLSVLIDAKVCSDDRFQFSRIEANQEGAMTRWIDCGNNYAYFALKLSSGIYMISFDKIEQFLDQGHSSMSKKEIENNITIEEWIDLMWSML